MNQGPLAKSEVFLGGWNDLGPIYENFMRKHIFRTQPVFGDI